MRRCLVQKRVAWCPRGLQPAARILGAPPGNWQLRCFAGEAPLSVNAELERVMEVRAERVRRELSILAEAFQRYDGDRSGALDKAEFVQALTDLNLPAGEFDIAALFNRLDADKSGTIELGEWLERLPRGTRLVIVERFEDEASSASVNAHRAVRLTVPSGKMIYTYTDEAPMLATYSLLPIIRAFTKSSKVTIQTRDISVAGRILASFPEHLTDKQQQADCLADLGNLAKTPVANIVKLPNVSASIPQLEAAISELQSQGFKVPSFPREPVTEEEKAVKARYSKVLGSAVNPVLREGNSDRRVAAPVKAYARAHPHRLKAWSSDSKTHVAHMTEGDFYGSEKSACMQKATSVRVELRHAVGGETQVLKSRTALLTGEVIDAAVLSVASLRDFYEREMLDCKKHDVLFSLHLKATMMKISDPIMFGHAVTVYFRDAFQKHAALFQEIGVVPDNGLADVLAKVQFLSDAKKRDEVLADLSACYSERPSLAMVDSDNGITNLHVPSDVIIDASMPPMIRDGGKMWNKEDKLQDTKALVPDRCYAGIFQATVEDCQTNGAFNVTTMGNVANVGLMAQKAEEYGSHDKTFKMARSGTVRVVDIDSGDCFFEHEVAEGDIWRMCQTKDSPIQDWVRLAVSRARATGSPATFWLDEARAHDAVMIGKVRQYLQDHDTSNLDISILPPVEAMKATLARVRQGLDSISVTGNVLRDYLTDLFPILELGTSAKMLSVVPLLAGGGLYETGAGGSAPKHVQQFVKESHLRWDSLGEFLALAVSLQDLGSKTGNPRALILADTLNAAIGTLLENDKSPKRKVGQLDNRGSHYYLATYWAEALASQTSSGKLAAEFTQVAASLKQKEESIVQELMSAAGKPADLGGYYRPDVQKTESAMRPSTTFNRIIDSLGQAGNRVEVMGEAERRAVSSISAPI